MDPQAAGEAPTWLSVGKSFQPQRQLMVFDSADPRKRSRYEGNSIVAQESGDLTAFQDSDGELDEFDERNSKAALALSVLANHPDKQLTFLPNGEVAVFDGPKQSAHLFVIDRNRDDDIPLFLNHHQTYSEPVAGARFDIVKTSGAGLFSRKRPTKAVSKGYNDERYFERDPTVVALASASTASPHKVHTFDRDSTIRAAAAALPAKDFVLLPLTGATDKYRFYRVAADDNYDDEELDHFAHHALNKAFNHSLHLEKGAASSLRVLLEYVRLQGHLLTLAESDRRLFSRRVLAKQEAILRARLFCTKGAELWAQATLAALLLHVSRQQLPWEQLERVVLECRQEAPTYALHAAEPVRCMQTFSQSSFASVAARARQVFGALDEHLQNVRASLQFSQSLAPSRSAKHQIYAVHHYRRLAQINKSQFYCQLYRFYGLNERAHACMQALLWLHLPQLCDAKLVDGDEHRALDLVVLERLWDSEAYRPFEASVGWSDLREVTCGDDSVAPEGAIVVNAAALFPPAPVHAGSDADGAAGARDAPPSEPAARQGQWVYSKVHGYRVFIPHEEDSSLVYKKLLGEMEAGGAGRDEERVAGLSVEDVLPAEDLQMYRAAHLRDRALSHLQFRPVRSLLEDASTIEMLERQPERCVLFRDIHDAVAHVPAEGDSRLNQMILVAALQGLGLTLNHADHTLSTPALHAEVFLCSLRDQRLQGMLQAFYWRTRRRDDNLSIWRLLQRQLAAASAGISSVEPALVDEHALSRRHGCDSRLDHLHRLLAALLRSPRLHAAFSVKFVAQLRRVHMEVMLLRHRSTEEPVEHECIATCRELLAATVQVEGAERVYGAYGSVIGDLQAWAQYLELEHVVHGRAEALKVADKALKSLAHNQAERVSGQPLHALLFPGMVRFCCATLRLVLGLNGAPSAPSAGLEHEGAARFQCKPIALVQALALVVQFALSGSCFSAPRGTGDLCEGCGVYRGFLRGGIAVEWRGRTYAAEVEAEGKGLEGARRRVKAVDLTSWLGPDQVAAAQAALAAKFEDLLEEIRVEIQRSGSSTAGRVDLQEVAELDSTHDLVHVIFLLAHLRWLASLHFSTDAHGDRPWTNDELCDVFLQAHGLGDRVFESALIRLRDTVAPEVEDDLDVEVQAERVQRQERALRTVFPLRTRGQDESSGPEGALARLRAALRRGLAERYSTSPVPQSRAHHTARCSLEHLHVLRLEFVAAAQLIFGEYMSAATQRDEQALCRALLVARVRKEVLSASLHALADFPLHVPLMTALNLLTTLYGAHATRRAYFASCHERVYWQQGATFSEGVMQALGEMLCVVCSDRACADAPSYRDNRSDCAPTPASFLPDWADFTSRLQMEAWSRASVERASEVLGRLLETETLVHCALLWRMYIHVALHLRRRGLGLRTSAGSGLYVDVRKLCFRAMHHCGGCKDVFMDVLGCASAAFETKDLRAITQLMETQGMYLRS